MKKILITGGCGFLGTNLALRGISSAHEIAIYDNFSRLGSNDNFKIINKEQKVKLYKEDIRNSEAVSHAISEFKPDWIFHLAGQVAMTTSIKNPRLDFEINLLGTLNVLESIRKYCP